MFWDMARAFMGEFFINRKTRPVSTSFINMPQSSSFSFTHFSPNWWFRFPVQQMLVSRIIKTPAVNFEVHRIRFDDGTICRLDVAGSMQNDKIIVLCPGLSGSYESPYCTHFAKAGIDAGYTVVVYTRRAHCADSISPTFPKHYDLADLQTVISWIDSASASGSKTLYGVGVSCGGNAMIKYAGDMGDDCRFKRIVSVSNGFDINAVVNHCVCNNDELMDKVITNFTREILQNVKGGGYDFGKKHSTFPALEFKAIKTFNDETPYMTNYYDDMSCIHVFDKVNVPVLCINSLDDPLFHLEKETYLKMTQDHPNISVILPSHGGHAGFVDVNCKCDWWCKNAVGFLTI